jgi:hypothetical protein
MEGELDVSDCFTAVSKGKKGYMMLKLVKEEVCFQFYFNYCYSSQLFTNWEIKISNGKIY